MTAIGGSQAASAAPKDKVDMLDGAIVDGATPENCSHGACGDDDVFIDPSDHTAGFNAAQIAATRASVVWAGAGAVANLVVNRELDVGARVRPGRAVAVLGDQAAED
jgi:hypothetical protein